MNAPSLIHWLSTNSLILYKCADGDWRTYGKCATKVWPSNDSGCPTDDNGNVIDGGWMPNVCETCGKITPAECVFVTSGGHYHCTVCFTAGLAPIMTCCECGEFEDGWESDQNKVGEYDHLCEPCHKAMPPVVMTEEYTDKLIDHLVTNSILDADLDAWMHSVFIPGAHDDDHADDAVIYATPGWEGEEALGMHTICDAGLVEYTATVDIPWTGDVVADAILWKVAVATFKDTVRCREHQRRLNDQ